MKISSDLLVQLESNITGKIYVCSTQNAHYHLDPAKNMGHAQLLFLIIQIYIFFSKATSPNGLLIIMSDECEVKLFTEIPPFTMDS